MIHKACHLQVVLCLVREQNMSPRILKGTWALGSSHRNGHESVCLSMRLLRCTDDRSSDGEHLSQRARRGRELPVRGRRAAFARRGRERQVLSIGVRACQGATTPEPAHGEYAPKGAAAPPAHRGGGS